MKTLYESLLDTETAIEKATNIVEKRYFLSKFCDLIDTTMSEYDKKWQDFKNILSSLCKEAKEPYFNRGEVIIAYKDNFRISKNLIGRTVKDSPGTLLLLYGMNLPNNSDNNLTDISIHIDKLYEHPLFSEDNIYTIVYSTTVGVYHKLNIRDERLNKVHMIGPYDNLIKTLKKMKLYKITGDVANELIEMSRYNNFKMKK